MINRTSFISAILICLGISSGYAQTAIDSMEAMLQKELSDSARVTTLLELSAAYEYVDVAKSKRLTEEAIQFIDAKTTQEYKAEAYQSLGSIHRLNGDYRSALKADNTALETGVLLKDSALIGVSYNNIGNDYYDLGEYDEAYHYFIQSYRISRLHRDSLTTVIALHNVGRVFKELGQYDRAMDYLTRAREMSLKINDKEGEPYSLSEIGDVLLRQGKYDSALKVLFLTLEKSKALDLNILKPRSILDIASIYVKQQDYKKALAYYDTANMLYEQTNNRHGIAEVKLGQGLTHLTMGRHNDALQLIENSLKLAKEQNANILEIQCYNHLSNIWEIKGNHEKALGFYKQFKQLEDTLFSQEMQGKLLRDQIQFETESKDFQIAELSEQQEQQRSELKKQEFVRNILVVVMALSGILLITVYRSGQRRRKINDLLLQHQEEMEKRSEELERLNQVKDKFFSIISHDLRSPINALSGLLDLLDKGAVTSEELPLHIKELRTRFNHTRTLLNNLLDWTLLQMDKLNLHAAKIDLNKITDENIQLLGPVQGKDINIVNKIPKPAIAFADSNTINLVIRNLLTNALKFTNEGGVVLIDGVEKEKEWVISVKDNGIGMKPDVISILFDKTAPYTTRGTANEKGTGLGLILCKEFVEKNGGKIWVESKEGEGSTFYFTTPKEV